MPTFTLSFYLWSSAYRQLLKLIKAISITFLHSSPFNPVKKPPCYAKTSLPNLFPGEQTSFPDSRNVHTVVNLLPCAYVTPQCAVIPPISQWAKSPFGFYRNSIRCSYDSRCAFWNVSPSRSPRKPKHLGINYTMTNGFIFVKFIGM